MDTNSNPNLLLTFSKLLLKEENLTDIVICSKNNNIKIILSFNTTEKLLYTKDLRSTFYLIQWLRNYFLWAFLYQWTNFVHPPKLSVICLYYLLQYHSNLPHWFIILYYKYHILSILGFISYITSLEKIFCVFKKRWKIYTIWRETRIYFLYFNCMLCHQRCDD